LDAGIGQEYNHLISIAFIAIPPQPIDITGNTCNTMILLYFSPYSYAAYMMHAAYMLCHIKVLFDWFNP
jgi:hypothetical protein